MVKVINHIQRFINMVFLRMGLYQTLTYNPGVNISEDVTKKVDLLYYYAVYDLAFSVIGSVFS
jgi:hypothetical protein